MHRSLIGRTAPLVALLAVAACRTATPRGNPATPPAPVPAAIPDSTPAAVMLTYRAGRTTYDYSASATVTLDGDTAARAERVTTNAVLRLELGGSGAELPLLVVVDSFAATSTARISASEQRLAAPVRITGTVSARTGALRLAADSADCASPAGAVRLIAREVLPPIRDTLVVGQRWTDTTETMSCRGGALLRSRNAATYLVEARDDRAPVPTIRLRRESAVTVEGTAGQGVSPPSVKGSGTESATFVIDTAAGRVTTMQGESNVAFQVTIGQRTQRFVQVATQQLRARAP